MKKWYYPLLGLVFNVILWLPLPALYLVSDFFYLIIYRIAGYRRKVVFTNLSNSFPEKHSDEIKRIADLYYHHMLDVIIETLKLATISKQELIKRSYFTNYEVIDELKKKGQPFLFVLGHMGNWEWMGPGFTSVHSTTLYALYHPLSSKFFNWYIYKLRTRFGGKLIPMNDVLREMVNLKNEYCAIAFISDQTPMPESALWVDFLNQETPVYTGTEKIAKKFNYPVVFASVKKIGRGHYQNTFHLITDNPKDTEDGFITKEHTRLLEMNIREMPHIWLWSHRRWKHKRNVRS